MAAAAQCGGESASDNLLGVAVAVALCLLHDLLGVAVFLASHPLHAIYLLIFARGLATLAAFFWPLLASTSLLLAVLATVGPYVGGAEWPGVRSLGRTCDIAVAALCAELRHDGADAGLVGQLCSFVIGPADAASVLRVEEIVGEHCDITASCFMLEEEESLLLIGGGGWKETAFKLPIMDSTIAERSFLRYEDFGDLKDEIDEKIVISEDLKISDSLAEQCCPSSTIFAQEMEAEEEENVIHGQGLILSATDEVSDGGEEKRLECDPVSVEIKKSEPLKLLEIKNLEPVEPMVGKKLEIKKSEPVHAIEIKKREPVQAAQIKKSEAVESVETKKCQPVQVLEIKKSEAVESVETKKCQPVQVLEIKKCEAVDSVETKKYQPVQALEIKKCEPVQTLEVMKFEPVEKLEIRETEPVEPVEAMNCEQVKPRSSIAQRFRLWEAQVSGNAKPVLADKEENSVEISMEKGPMKDVKKCVRFEADPGMDKRNSEQQAQEVAPNEESTEEQQEQEFKDVKEYTRSEASIEKCSQNNEAEEIVLAVAQEEGCKDALPEPELQEQVYEIEQSEQELQEMDEVYTDVTSSLAVWSERESPMKSTSIAGRVHSRTLSENLVSEGSPSRKDKEWKRTLACKLYEERLHLRLCRNRAVVEGSDNMDLLWEAYEVGNGGGNGRDARRCGSKAKGGANKVEELVDEAEQEEEDDDDKEEGSVRQLCCLQALKFSTRKMNFGGGKPSLSKISKVLRRMTALSRMGSRRKQSG